MLTNEQIEIRKRTVGASESAAALGLSKWKTSVEVYMEKIGMAPMQEDSDAMYWGREFEEPIAKRYEKETGKELRSHETVTGDKYPFMSCNLDRWIVDDNAETFYLKAKAAVECKNVGYFSDEWGIPGTDEIPTDYLIQVAHQAIVCDLDYVDIAVLGNRYDFRIYRYNRNPKLEEKIIEGLRKFWYENVLKEIPPEPKTISDLTLMPKKEESPLSADSEFLMLHESYQQLKEQEKHIDKRIEDLKFDILKRMGDSTCVIDEGKSIFSFNKYERQSIDTKKLKEEHPDLYEKFCRKTEYRIFRAA